MNILVLLKSTEDRLTRVAEDTALFGIVTTRSKSQFSSSVYMSLTLRTL